jgi:acyl carrier protein
MSAAERKRAEAVPYWERVTQIIAEHLGVKTETDGLSRDTHLADDLLADAIDQIEIALAMEDEFDIAITDDQGASCETIGDWRTLVHQLLAAKP